MCASVLDPYHHLLAPTWWEFAFWAQPPALLQLQCACACESPCASSLQVGPESVGASEGFLGWIAYLGAANAGIPLSIIVKNYGWEVGALAFSATGSGQFNHSEKSH